MTSDYISYADVGGQPADAPIKPEAEGLLWHHAWEPKALALTLAMGATGAWNLDMSRAARETLSDYARRSYYEVWVGALVALLEERGLVGSDELNAGRALHPGPQLNKLLAQDVPRVVTHGSPTVRSATGAALFKVGQRVRTRSDPVSHHTRLPGYARGKVGRVTRVHGAHVFADAHASGKGEQPQWLYTVTFAAADLWRDGQAGVTVSIDAWEPYLAGA